jgi:NADPH2 dehydrogenase
MRYFRFKTLPELEQETKSVGASHVLFEHDVKRVQAALSRKVQVGKVTVGNSMAIHPMEGCDGTLEGDPTDLTRRRYERFARGGAKLVWFEATAVREDGRANTRQLWLHPGSLDSYKRIYEDMLDWHRDSCGNTNDLLIPLQLTHSGRFAVPKRTIAFHQPQVDERTNTKSDWPIVTDDEVERLEDAYIETAKLAWKAGFRCFDVKTTHGYLLAELLDAKQRQGRYGTDLDGRTRAMCNILKKLRQELGPEAILSMRLGCFTSVPFRKGADGKGEPLPYQTPYSYGFGTDPDNPLQYDLAEVKQAIALFQKAGLQLLNVSIGCPYYNPHFGRPFEAPDEGSYEEPEHPLLGVDRHFAIAKDLQQSFPDLPIIGTGYSWLQQFAAAAAAKNIQDGHITFFGYGRGALAYPDFAKSIEASGSLEAGRVCKTLTYCTFLMRRKDHPLGQWPTGCPPFDKEGYGEIMKEARKVQRGEKLVSLVATP